MLLQRFFFLVSAFWSDGPHIPILDYTKRFILGYERTPLRVISSWDVSKDMVARRKPLISEGCKRFLYGDHIFGPGWPKSYLHQPFGCRLFSFSFLKRK